MFSHVLKFLIFSTLIQFASYANGLSTDDVIIKSDNLHIDQKEGKAYFTGNVIVWFDDAILKTTEINLIIKERQNKRELDRIIFPAKLTSMHESGNEMIVADSGEYIVASNLLTFKGNIFMQKDESSVRCNELKYYTKIKAIKTTKDKAI